jgi:hypothetical protein
MPPFLIISEDDLARNRTSHMGTCVPLILIKAGPARPTTSLGEDQQRPDAGLLGITSSASTTKSCGTVRPSALAILQLIISSYLVETFTGTSLGFSPLRMIDIGCRSPKISGQVDAAGQPAADPKRQTTVRFASMTSPSVT